MSHTLLRQNATGIILGGSATYNKKALTPLSTQILVVSFPVHSTAIAKGLMLSFYGENAETSKLTVALADHNGRIIHKTMKTSTVTAPDGSQDDSVPLKVPFKHEVKLEAGKTYYALVQLLETTMEGIDGWDNTGSLIYPNSKLITRTLKHLKHFHTPTHYTNDTAVAGTLY
jgi:hypothetical protein